MKRNENKENSFAKFKTAIISVIVSIVLWVAIVNTVNPDVTETLYNVPIRVSGIALLQRNGYVITNSEELPDCNVKIRGKRKEIIELKDRVYGEINVSEVNVSDIEFNEKGKKWVAVVINSPYSIGVEKQSISSVMVNVERCSSREIPIKIKQKNVPADKIVKSETEVERILVSGAQEELQKVEKCEVAVDLAGADGDFNATYPFVYLSKDGQVIDVNTVFSDVSNIRVSHKFYHKKEVDVKLDIPGYMLNEYRIEYDNAKIVCGVDSQNNDISEIHYKVDNLTEGENEIKIADEDFEEGIYIPEESSTIKIKAEKLVTQQVAVKTECYNLNEDLKAEVKGLEKYEITATETELKDVKAKINLENIGEGTHVLPMEFENENIKNQYDVTVVLSRKED